MKLVSGNVVTAAERKEGQASIQINAGTRNLLWELNIIFRYQIMYSQIIVWSFFM